MKNRFLLLFYLYQAKKNLKGLSPIYCRINVNSIHAEISTAIFTTREKWSGKRIKGSSREAVMQNNILSDIENDIRQIYYELNRNNRAVSAKRIKQLFKEKGSCSGPTLLQCYQEFYTRKESLAWYSH